MDTPQDPQPPQNKTHKVVKNDTLIGIARKYGHKDNDWTKIWNHPSNRSVASKRGKPELIQPGDIFIVPPSAKEMQEYEEAKRKAEEEKQKENEQVKQIEARYFSLFSNKARNLATSVSFIERAWDDAKKNDDENKIIGWVLHNLPGSPDFPDKGPITKAQSAVSRLQSIVNSKDYTAWNDAHREACRLVDEAAEMMSNYRKKLLGTGETTISVLEGVRDVSMGTLGVLAAVATGGASLSVQVAAAGGVAGLQGGLTAFSELKKPEDIAISIAKDATVGSLATLAGGKLAEHVGPILAEKGGPMLVKLLGNTKWIKLSSGGAEKFLEAWIENAGENVVKDLLEELKDFKWDMSAGEIFTKLAGSLVKATVVATLGPWLEKSSSKVISAKILPIARSKFAQEKVLKKADACVGEIAAEIIKTCYPLIQDTVQEFLLTKGPRAKSAEELGDAILTAVANDPKVKKIVAAYAEKLADLEKKKKK